MSIAQKYESKVRTEQKRLLLAEKNITTMLNNMNNDMNKKIISLWRKYFKGHPGFRCWIDKQDESYEYMKGSRKPLSNNWFHCGCYGKNWNIDSVSIPVYFNGNQVYWINRKWFNKEYNKKLKQKLVRADIPISFKQLKSFFKELGTELGTSVLVREW